MADEGGINTGLEKAGQGQLEILSRKTVCLLAKKGRSRAILWLWNLWRLERQGLWAGLSRPWSDRFGLGLEMG